MRLFFILGGCLFLQITFGQSATIHQQLFCSNLNKVFELGRKDNFDSYDGTLVKQSAVLPVPGYSISFDDFPITYVDKDNRFVGKTNQNFDSLSAINKLGEYKTCVNICLDSVQWSKWHETIGDDSATVFFKETKELNAVSNEFTLTLAVVKVAAKAYTVNLYIRRKK